MQNIVVDISKNFEGIDVHQPKLEKLVKAICSRFKISQATVDIAIVDDAQIRKINKQFLNRDYATDCLSFDLSDENDTRLNENQTRENELETLETSLLKSFELVVNGQRAIEEAKLRGQSGEAELALYITHGLLHTLGFDDSRPDKAEKMHMLENEILQQQGFGLVYNKGEKAR